MTEKDYTSEEKGGVICITLAGFASLIAILYFFIFKRNIRKSTANTHLFGYFVCLMLANMMQAIGTIMNTEWVAKGGIETGPFCTAQGGIKQAGNLAITMWSNAIAVYLFELIFLRIKSGLIVFWLMVVFGWGIVLTIVLVGPFVIQEPANGPYFGISGAWCWITNEYPSSQVYLEYLFMFFAAGLTFVLYTFILLRVRGNLTKVDGKWKVQFLPSGESWKLSLSRDLLDMQVLNLVKRMIWYPITYTVLLLPIAFARLYEFSGMKVPFGVTVFTATVFNLMGFINVILLVTTEKLFPDAQTLPEFSTPRKHISISLSKSGGIVPFTLESSETSDRYMQERAARVMPGHSRMDSALSYVSTKPLAKTEDQRQA